MFLILQTKLLIYLKEELISLNLLANATDTCNKKRLIIKHENKKDKELSNSDALVNGRIKIFK